VFAQILNLVYLSSPISEGQVSFFDAVNAISALQVSRDSIKALLNGCLNSPLHADANKYRSTSTHRNVLYFRVLMETDPFVTLQPPPRIAAILIADDPKVTPLSFSEKRDFRSFGPKVLQHTKATIDCVFRIMERTVRTVDQIPV
jgi:hypothetical protein